ncbi:hypothetical protein E0W68_04465 [Flavobacterium salilacus subsp. salilacus]|uniref:hypothetical protein n=1 Tax=Flavobacterium TaxID=237 RepID=UPI00107584A7|nr:MULTISPECIES: hypothetical protein [Flavobacterium]KAF2519603.1 hypothetical protein E0W68_04465 [Flavobacterium salilacus subsp. salilacus]MBE1614495.1 hypothetical protein [Flavobacterium sp. SaA2.13]
MKPLKHINFFFVGFPLFLGGLGFIMPGLWMIAALFTILTGGFQVVAALGWTIIKGYKNVPLIIYWVLTVVFFVMWYLTNWGWIWFLPPFLAMYFTIILHYLKIDEL